MNNDIKLIALDIDGTIMDSQFRISDNVKNTIKKAQDRGIYVVIATGRMYSSAAHIAEELGITTPLITYQGSLIKEFNPKSSLQNVILNHHVPSDLAKIILKEIRTLNLQANVYLNDKLFVEYESPTLKEYVEKRFITYTKVKSFDIMTDLNPTKILAIDNDPNKITELRNYLFGKYHDVLNIEKSMPIYCEVVNKDASKGNAILHLAKMWNISQSQIMTIGDHDNDQEMIEIAGLGIAMGNATDKLKNIAKYVTDTVDNDGAAKAIQKFALKDLSLS